MKYGMPAGRFSTDASSLKLLTWDDTDAKSTFWHSTAHLMAEAVQRYSREAKFWVGPAVDKGFYYDMDLGDKRLTEDDLAILEKKMSELAKQNNVYVRKAISKAEAIQYFHRKGRRI
jgi:threonyl-tRNA synthetase